MMALMIIMPRFSRNIRPVHSIKHVVDTQGGLIAGTQATNDIVEGVDAPTLATVDRVETGSRVGSIFLNVQVAATGTAALANVYMAVCKNPGGNLTFPNANVLGASDNKKYVIHQEMIMTEKNTTAIARTLFKGVIKIPRGYARFGINDKLILLLFAPGVDFDFCFQSIYKEYR